MKQGVHRSEQYYDKDVTILFMVGATPIGFATYRLEDDYLWFIHFIVDHKYRGDLIRETLKYLRVIPKSHGFNRFVIGLNDTKRKFNRLIRLHYGVEPYKHENNQYYYEIGI